MSPEAHESLSVAIILVSREGQTVGVGRKTFTEGEMLDDAGEELKINGKLESYLSKNIKGNR